MKTRRAFVLLTLMVVCLSAVKGQASESFPELRSLPDETIPTDNATSESDLSDSPPRSAYQPSSPTKFLVHDVTPPVTQLSHSTTVAAVHEETSTSPEPSQKSALDDVTITTRNPEAAPLAGFISMSPANPNSTKSNSESNTAPATSSSSSEAHQIFPLPSSSVSQTTQPGPSSYPWPSLLALPSSSKVASSAPSEDPDEPSELDVGDEELGKVSHHPPSPMDPLLAALVTIFIICTAMVSAVLFLRFRQRSEHPEFHRLQDLPMDDLLEDTPLSRYSY